MSKDKIDILLDEFIFKIQGNLNADSNWIQESANNLYSEGIGKDGLLSLIKDECGEAVMEKLATILNANSNDIKPNVQGQVAVKWKPKKWIVILLALSFPPFALLYVARAKWAVIYFLIPTIVVVLDIWLNGQQVELAQYVYFSYVLSVVCAVHGYSIAKGYDVSSVRPWFSRWYGLTSLFSTLVISVIIVRSFLYEPFETPAGSMSPTLNPGDVVLVSKWGYGNYGTFGISLVNGVLTKELKRGDVIVFEYPKDRSTIFMKRIIGLPGDSVIYDKGTLVINGEAVTKKLTSTEGNYQVFTEMLGGVHYGVKFHSIRSSAAVNIIIPAGQVFVLGDNRDNSNDSRYWGYLPIENIVGKVVYIIQPNGTQE